MTRGKIIIIAEEKVLTSIEFNGDMYLPGGDWAGYGKDVIDGLKDVKTEQEYKDFVLKFNAEHHGYDDVDEFTYDLLEECKKYEICQTEEELLDMSSGYFDKWFSDYLYIKNLRSEAVTVYDDEGRVLSVEPNGILVLNFGTYEKHCAEYSIGVTTVVKMHQKYIGICENLGWWLHIYEDDDSVEVGKESPAGEDFFFSVSISNFVEDVKEYASDFDPDEHAEMWIESRGTKGVPASIRQLIDDADAIGEMLEELAEALAKTQM